MMDTRTRSQRWADWITEFSGSWPFIFWFSFGCAAWIMLNSLLSVPFDPAPWIGLNLCLTIVSTFQSPIILMSQNRQNDMDRVNVQEILTRVATLQASVDALPQGKE